MAGRRVLLEVDGKVWSLPREWTDLIPPSSTEVIGKGEALFGVEDLMKLMTLLDSLTGRKASK